MSIHYAQPWSWVQVILATPYQSTSRSTTQILRRAPKPLALLQRGRWSPEHHEEAYDTINRLHADNSSTPTPTPAAATTSMLQPISIAIHKQMSSESECPIHRAVNPLSSPLVPRELILYSSTSSMKPNVRHTLARATSEITSALPWWNPGFLCCGGWWLG